MVYQSSIVTVSVVLFVLASISGESEARSVNLPSPQCHPSVVKTMKPRIRQICKALEAIWEFSDVMENYLDEKVLLELLDQYLMGGVKPTRDELDHVFLRFEDEEMMNYERPEPVEQQRPLYNMGVKRKGDDVDHVFLRFGKRSGRIPY